MATGSGWPGRSRYCLVRRSYVSADPGPKFYKAIHAIIVQRNTRCTPRICLTLPADAQDSLRPDQPTPNSATSPEPLTGKERLGRKWMDEQRIDHCKVPIDKRGNGPRPSVCPHVPTGYFSIRRRRVARNRTRNRCGSRKRCRDRWGSIDPI